jgi:threonine/homoserine/homoserine lactone efflux protein
MAYATGMDAFALSALAALALFAAPGPTNALLFAAGAARGFSGAAWLAGLVLAAYVLACGSARLVLEPLLADNPLAGRALKLVLGAYVLWLALRLWRGGAQVSPATAVRGGSVFLTTLLNPKALVLAFVILPDRGLPMAILAASAAILVASLAWIAFGAAASAALGARRRAAIPRGSALALAALGGLTLSSALG